MSQTTVGVSVCMCVVLTNSILGRQLHVVCVQELEERPVHREGELVYLNHLLQVLIPVGLEHGSEVFTPAPDYCRTDDTFFDVAQHVRSQTLAVDSSPDF